MVVLDRADRPPTLSLLLPQIRQYVPPWYVWTIGFLFISLVAIFEGGFRQVQKLRGIYNPLKLSLALSRLPVYAQDIDIKILCIRRGVSYLVLTEEIVFLQLKIFSTEDAQFRNFGITLSTADDNYRGTP